MNPSILKKDQVSIVPAHKYVIQSDLGGNLKLSYQVIHTRRGPVDIYSVEIGSKEYDSLTKDQAEKKYGRCLLG